MPTSFGENSSVCRMYSHRHRCNKRHHRLAPHQHRVLLDDLSSPAKPFLLRSSGIREMRFRLWLALARLPFLLRFLHCACAYGRLLCGRLGMSLIGVFARYYPTQRRGQMVAVGCCSQRIARAKLYASRVRSLSCPRTFFTLIIPFRQSLSRLFFLMTLGL